AIKHVLEVSEAPFTLMNSISADTIVDTWKTGAGNFQGVAMKAWVLARNHEILPINLTAIVKSDDTMRFDFFLPDDAMLAADRLGPLEDVTIVNYCCHPGDKNGEWLWGN
ncbi:MAG: hypothetical protein GY788_20650, partial [bacterium]|nr:hypothetical protein [bacterium]